MICIINCGTSYLDNIIKLLNNLGQENKAVNIDKLDNTNFNSFSGIIITGAPTLLTRIDLKKYLKPFEILNSLPIPILGICLGHQIIGLLHGAKISRGEFINKKESIEIINKNKLFSNIKNRSYFQEEHSEYITLPKGFHLLAESASCKNEAMKHKNKKLYGVQFHPEVSGGNGIIIIRNFLQFCNK